MRLVIASARLIAALFALATLLFAAAPARAQNDSVFTLGPGGSAEITFVAYCTEFGKFFPPQILLPDGTLATDPVRAALQYIADEGLSADPATALEANFAIWQLAGFARATGGAAVTQDVRDNATTPPADPPGATSVLAAAAAGDVTLTLRSWAPIGDKVQILSATDNFYGRGTLLVENRASQNLTLFMPVGTIFPGSETRFQRMGAYAEAVDLIDARLPTTAVAEPLPLTLVALALALLGGSILMQRRAERITSRR
jgi:hypothetical protein